MWGMLPGALRVCRCCPLCGVSARCPAAAGVLRGRLRGWHGRARGRAVRAARWCRNICADAVRSTLRRRICGRRWSCWSCRTAAGCVSASCCVSGMDGRMIFRFCRWWSSAGGPCRSLRRTELRAPPAAEADFRLPMRREPGVWCRISAVWLRIRAHVRGTHIRDPARRGALPPLFRLPPVRGCVVSPSSDRASRAHSSRCRSAAGSIQAVWADESSPLRIRVSAVPSMSYGLIKAQN